MCFGTFLLIVSLSVSCSQEKNTPISTETDTEDGPSHVSTSTSQDSGDTTNTETEVPSIHAPTDLVAFSPFGQRVELSWTDHSEYEDGYSIFRSCSIEQSTDGDGFCHLADLTPDSTNYNDHTSHAGQNYTYKVTTYAEDLVQSTEVTVKTPQTMETSISPQPKGAWRLAENEQTLEMPSHINIDANIEFSSLRILLRGEDPYSLPARLEASGLSVSTNSFSEVADTGTMELYFHQIDGPEPSSMSSGLVTFEKMGDEGFVILVEPSGSGLRMTISANTPAGLYRGGMASLNLLLDPANNSLRSHLQHLIVLDYPDHSVRSYYDSPNDGDLNQDESALAPDVLTHLDQMSRATANLAFHKGHAFAPMLESFLSVTWEEQLEDIRHFETAAKDRFIDLVAEVGETHASPSRFPSAYAFVDGLGVHEEPFILEEQTDGHFHAIAASPVRQLVSDSEMSAENAWNNPNTQGCTNWSYDSIVGHNIPGSWRLDADGDGSCSILRIPLEATDLQDGRYLMAVRVRLDTDSAYLGPFSGSAGQITLVVRYDEGTPNASSLQRNERSISIGQQIASVDPTKANNDGNEEWLELYTTVILDGQADGKTVTSAEIYARSISGIGTYWIDELSLERIDGSLWNVVGGVEAPLVTNRDRTITYQEGVDYTVCQVGEDGWSGVYKEICSDQADAANYTTVFNVRSASGTIHYGFEPRFSRDLQPFQIRWLTAGSWPENGEILVSYDINLPYQGQYSTTLPGQDYISQRLNFCQFDSVFTRLEWGKAFDRVVGSAEGQLGASHIRLGLSEARGLNRSRLCHERLENNGIVRWTAKESNAALFANVANRLITETLDRNPAARVYFWDDMLNPFFNGGQDGYQSKFGGPLGATACSLGAQTLPLLCDEVLDVTAIDPRAIMIHWTYYQKAARQTHATAQYYEQTGRPWLVGTGGSERVAEDWAAIAKSSSTNLGVSAFLFGDANIPHALRTFWRYDWQLHYQLDFETVESSLFQLDAPLFEVVEGAATIDSLGDCASYGSQNTSLWAGNQDGGLCITSVEDGLLGTISEVEASAERSYRAGLHLKWQTEDEQVAPQIRLVFSLADGGSESTNWMTTEEVVIEKKADDFVRYEITEVVAPTGTIGLKMDLQLPAGVISMDNILLWESTPACFDNCTD